MLEPIHNMEKLAGGYDWYKSANHNNAYESLNGWRLSVEQGLPHQAMNHKAKFTEVYHIDECQRAVDELVTLGVEARPFTIIEDLRSKETMLVRGPRLDWRIQPIETVFEPIPAKALAARETAERYGYKFERYWFAAPVELKVRYQFVPRLTRPALRLWLALCGSTARSLNAAVQSALVPSLERAIDPVLLGSRGPVLIELARWI